MDAAEVEAGDEEGAGVVGVGMEAMVDMSTTTKVVMVDMDTKEDMDIKVDTATREDMDTTKVVMGVMVTTKVDMEDMVSAKMICLFNHYARTSVPSDCFSSYVLFPCFVFFYSIQPCMIIFFVIRKWWRLELQPEQRRRWWWPRARQLGLWWYVQSQ